MVDNNNVGDSIKSDDDWNYEHSIVECSELVQGYLAITDKLIARLRDAHLALSKEHFAGFCDSIGISVVVAERWLNKYEDKRADGDEKVVAKPSIDETVILHKKILLELKSLRAFGADIFDITSAALLLGCSEEKVCEFVERMGLPSYLLAGEVRILKDELLRWLRLQPNGSFVTVGGTDNDEHEHKSDFFKVTNAAMKRGGVKSEKQKNLLKTQVLKNLQLGMGITQAVREVGIAWSTFHEWKKADQEFEEKIRNIRGW